MFSFYWFFSDLLAMKLQRFESIDFISNAISHLTNFLNQTTKTEKKETSVNLRLFLNTICNWNKRGAAVMKDDEQDTKRPTMSKHSSVFVRSLALSTRRQKNAQSFILYFILFNILLPTLLSPLFFILFAYFVLSSLFS